MGEGRLVAEVLRRRNIRGVPINLPVMVEEKNQMNSVKGVVFIFQREVAENGVSTVKKIEERGLTGCVLSDESDGVVDKQSVCDFLKLVFFIFRGFLGFCGKVEDAVILNVLKVGRFDIK